MNKRQKVSGIYQIRCKRNGQRYIGQAIDIHGRWASHRKDLASGKHCNNKLLKYFRKYGAKSLEFTILEKCHPARLDRQEAIWIYRRGDMNEVRPRIKKIWLVGPWELQPELWALCCGVGALVAMAVEVSG